MFSLIGKTNIDFVGKRYVGFVVSACFIVLGLVGLYRVGTGHAKLAIDFSGGTTLNMILKDVVHVDDLRKALKTDYPDAEIQQVAGKSQYLIRIRKSNLDTGATAGHAAKLVQ